MKNQSGRNFTISVKPMHSYEQIDRILNELKGVATVFAITHDKDTTEKGEQVEPHTHYLLSYDTPRRLTTVSNLFGVAPNFVEIVKSHKAMLRYLTHKDDDDKYQYSDKEVITNGPVAYEEAVLGGSLSNHEIVRYIREGRALDLIDTVQPGRLRLLQQIVSNDRQGEMLSYVRELRNEMYEMKENVYKIKEIAEDFQLAVAGAGMKMLEPLQKIARLAEDTLRSQRLGGYKKPTSRKG